MNLLDNNNLQWQRYTGGDAFDYPIDYSDAVLDARKDGRLELLVKWEPNCYCHFHLLLFPRLNCIVTTTRVQGTNYELCSEKNTSSP